MLGILWSLLQCIGQASFDQFLTKCIVRTHAVFLLSFSVPPDHRNSLFLYSFTEAFSWLFKRAALLFKQIFISSLKDFQTFSTRKMPPSTSNALDVLLVFLCASPNSFFLYPLTCSWCNSVLGHSEVPECHINIISSISFNPFPLFQIFLLLVFDVIPFRNCFQLA